MCSLDLYWSVSLVIDLSLFLDTFVSRWNQEGNTTLRVAKLGARWGRGFGFMRDIDESMGPSVWEV